jgi:ketosteroid isomerase-like protein
MKTANEIIQTGNRWAAAERSGDRAALESLLDDDFRAVGPAGFVLDKSEWIGRHEDAQYESLSWENVDVRRFGDIAVAIGDQSQAGVFRGHRVEGCFRMTQVLVQRDGGWHLASIHLSPTVPSGTSSTATEISGSA